GEGTAEPPGRAVVTVIDVLKSRGYCRIWRPSIAFSPISRMSRLTTSASTGRLIKISVNFIDHALKRHSGIARRARPGIHEHGPLEYGFQLAAPLGARLRAPVGWRIFDAPGRPGMTKTSAGFTVHQWRVGLAGGC